VGFKRRVGASVALVAMLVGLAGAGADAAPAQGSTEVPLRLSGTVTESPTPDPACGGLHNAPSGTLTGQPLGETHWQSQHCVDATAEPGVLVVRDGHLTLTSSRGGTLTASYGAHGSLPSTLGHIYLAGTFTITDGTGRFLGATGDGLLTVVADPIASVAKVDMAGTLRLPITPHEKPQPCDADESSEKEA
jgi:hypothetical protein